MKQAHSTFENQVAETLTVTAKTKALLSTL